MKKQALLLASVIFAAVAMTLAQVSPEPAGANSKAQDGAVKTQNSDTLASGAVLAVELSKSLDAKKNRVNDRIEAKTATDLLAHGRIVVPRNTKIIGRVTEVKAHSKDSPDSMVGIIFDRLLMKDGREVPLQLVVQAIARPLQFGSGSDVGVSPANRTGMPGQRGPIADSSTSGASTSSLPSSYPGGLAPIPDPMAPSSTTVVALDPTSKGVVGMKGLSLDTSGPAAVLTSNTANVHLESGMQLILRVQ